MDFFDLVNIAEQYMEVVNPSTPEKILKIGQAAGLKPGHRVLDMGCGFGEELALWAAHYGIHGIGVDIRPYACQRATQKMHERGLHEHIQIVCMNAARYEFERGAFDIAACIGATFIWPSYADAIRTLKEALRPGGRLIVGEAYWQTAMVPPAFAIEQNFLTERELLDITRREGFDIEYIVRASADDWDRYESDNWVGLLRWIEQNPTHPERQQVIDHLHAKQTEYFTFGRQFFGWAMFVLTPRSY